MKTFFVTLILTFLSNHTQGQNTIGLPQIINYSTAEFHGGTQTWDIRQGKNGIMYFANNEGLITFNGSHWSVYPIPNKTNVRALYINNDNKIFVGAQDEFGYFLPDDNGILQYTSLKNLIPITENSFADIWDIEPLGESIFFRASDRIFELKNNTIQVFKTSSEWQFLKAVDGKLIAQDKKLGLMQYKNNIWYPITGKEPFNNILVSGIIEAGKDSLLISTLKNGLFLYSKDSILIKTTTADAQLIRSQAYALAEMNNKEFVVGSTSQGCLVMNYAGEIIQKITHEEGLQNNNILCLFVDNNNNLWTGLNNGISFIAYNSAIKYIRPNKTNDLSGYNTKIFQDNLYIATSDGTHTVQLDKSTDISFCKGDFVQIKNTNGQVWRLEEINQQLLMGYNDGIYAIQNKEAVAIKKGAGAWIFNTTSAIYPSPTILAGTYTGLELLGFANNKLFDLNKIDGINESLRFVAIDNDNAIWASHPYRGVYKIVLSASKKTCTALLLTGKEGLPSALGNYVFKIKNRVVFATEKGVFEYVAATGRFIPSPLLHPIFGNIEIRYLNEDAEGNIWFCSGKKIGVVVFTRSNEGKPTITYFSELTGQVLYGFENIYAYNKQNIFIGSEKGMIHLNFEKYIAGKAKPTILIAQVKAIGNKDSLIFGGHFTPDKSVPSDKQKEIMQLPHGFNSFHFEYSSPAFGVQNNIEYSYQLIGYDDKWSPWTTKTEKDYTNLPHGKYTFQVKAHDNLGYESTIINYSFIVNPAWYNTNWAYLLYFLLFIFSIYLLKNWEIKKLNRQQILFDEEQKKLKYIHQLELEKNEKEIIKLQNEKLAGEVVFKNKELADVSMHLVERGDALSKVKEELQKLYKNNAHNHDVKKALQLLNDVEKNNENWNQFATHFDEVNNDFLKKIKLKFPVLSNTDLKVCAYLQLNLSSKEIAQLMNISVRGVEISRYRLRKKLQIPTEQTLNDFLNEMV